MIMAEPGQLKNRVREHRLERGWSQWDLANRAGISRAAVSAIEISRLVPSVAAALSLAQVFGCTVEDLFGEGSASQPDASPWAWTIAKEPCRYWQAAVGGRVLSYAVEPTAAGLLEHDGVFQDGSFRTTSRFMPERTLVMASCDPAAGLLAAEVNRLGGCRVIVLPRSSQEALALLAKGLVHVAGLHLSTDNSPNGNCAAVRSRIGSGCCLLHVARWQEGVALSSKSRLRSVQAVVRSKARWVAREPGSGARQCLDELLHHRRLRRVARDHRGVAEAVRCDWADAGVCVRLACEEAGLQFLSVREEVYQLCFRAECQDDRRIRALKDAVRSASYRRLLGELPGYRPSACGDLESVN